MKKVLSLVLVVLMVAGLSASAFADNDPREVYVVNTKTIDLVDDTTGVATASDVDVSKVYIQTDGVWSDEDDSSTAYTVADIKPGDVAAIQIIKVTETYVPVAGSSPAANAYQPTASTTNNANFTKKEVEKLKAFFDATKGSFAEGPVVEQIKIGSTGTDYAWVVSFKAPDPTTSVDVIGEIAVAKTSSAAKNATYKYEFAASIGWEPAPIDAGKNGVVKVTNKVATTVFNFKSDAGEVDIEFGANGDIALYNVEASSQGKTNLKYSTKFNADVAAKYPNANIDFVSFVKAPSFNKTGTLYIYADKDTFIYEVTADGLKAIDATYDESEEAWKFKTRTLGAYAIADAELKIEEVAPESSVAPSEDSKPAEETAKPNPGTGR